MLTVGAHISTGKSLPGALRAMVDLGGNAIQVFSRNPRGGRARAIPEREIALFREQRRALGVRTCVFHAPYTINLASAKPEVREFGIRVVGEDLVRGAALGVDFLVMHPGSHGGAGEETGIALTASGLRAAWECAAGEVDPDHLPQVVLENMSGSGSEIGGDLCHLVRVLSALNGASWLGFCLDTAHAHGAGYDLATEEGRDRLLDDWKQLLGFDRMLMIHLNDSLAGAGSRRDRHALLGTGTIGSDGLGELCRHPMLTNLPFIIETPVRQQQDYAHEIAQARAWAGKGRDCDE